MIVAPRARADLEAIHRHIEKDNPLYADRAVERLTERIGWLAETGFQGVARDWVRPGLRGLLVGSHCIYFRCHEDRLAILRVLHSHQDIATQPIDPQE